MNFTSSKRILTGFALLVALIALPFLSIMGHGHDDDNDHDEGTAPDSMMDIDTGAVQDSIYSLINEKYQNVRHIFKYSCFDCHSDTTHYPWYHGIPGIKGMIDDDIKHAKKHLDLTNDFPFGGHGTQLETLSEIKEQIEEGDMPIMSYRMMHWGRTIDGKKRDSVFAWINESVALLKANK